MARIIPYHLIKRKLHVIKQGTGGNNPPSIHCILNVIVNGERRNRVGRQYTGAYVSMSWKNILEELYFLKYLSLSYPDMSSYKYIQVGQIKNLHLKCQPKWLLGKRNTANVY